MSRPYSSVTPLPKIAPHVQPSQRFGETAYLRGEEGVTKLVAPLGASGPHAVKWADVAGARETRAIPEPLEPPAVPLPWPLRVACGGLALVLLPVYLVSRLVKEEA